ncbi:hypothetical protein HUO13_30435 [Saccharopolyspora erythraea]|uniref:hypothetical protein n=1 Tax=Saccharopolyspora erythraea TaxID=1836 RepID=UPI001BAD2F27|nr:hypothetical protein [Saccharopolyspora erythraea]QUH04521.1 hypothetical protein HUO13_30435 [Saccharopolyspora erythraea]
MLVVFGPVCELVVGSWEVVGGGGSFEVVVVGGGSFEVGVVVGMVSVGRVPGGGGTGSPGLLGRPGASGEVDDVVDEVGSSLPEVLDTTSELVSGGGSIGGGVVQVSEGARDDVGSSTMSGVASVWR